MILSTLWIFTAIQVIVRGQTIAPVYVQSNAPVTLTCPADDQATFLTWTGPGGALYVTGITVETGLNAGVKSRISASHTGGSYTLTFTEFLSSDTGIYTCTVDGAVDLQMVIVQGVTSASPVYTRQGGTVTLQCPDTGGTARWTVTGLVYTLRTQINPDSKLDFVRTRLNVTREGGTYNLQISDVQLSDVREYRCSIGVTDTFYHLLLYIPPRFPGIENTVSVAGQNRTTGTEDGSVTLTCNARGGTPAASVSWMKDGTSLVTSDNTVQYTKVFTRADDRTVYTCQWSSPALTSPQTTSVLVYLDLKPGQPTISDQLSQTENTNLQVVCVSTGSRPAAAIEWNVGGTWQSSNPTEVKVLDSATDTYTVTSTLSRPVTRQDNGKSVYCRASNRALSGGIESVRRSITVLFGPDGVSITGNRVNVADGTNTLTLTCTTQEYNRHVHITWYNGTTRISNTAFVTNTSGINGGSVSTQVLQLTPDRYQDGNVVRCLVQNEDMTLGQKTASVTLNLNYPPSTPVSVSVNPTTEGRENSTAVLTCHVTGGKPTPSLLWTCPAGVSTTAPTTGSQGDSHTSVITVTLARQPNGQRCSCIGSQTDTTWTGSDQSSVFAVRFGPDGVSITGNRVIVADSTNTLTLTCTTQEYNRYVHITWYNGTTRISNTAVVTNTSGTNGGSVSTQVLQLTPDRYQDGNVVRCVVQNEDVMLEERTMSVTLDINYRPYLTLTPTPGVKVTENGDLEIRCDVDSNPPSSITWSRIGGQLPSNADVTSGVLRIPSTHRTDKGTYQCTAQNPTGIGQDSLVIDVQYPPDIHVSYTNTTYTSPDRVLACIPDGNPDIYQFGEWRHTMEDGTEIRQLTGSSDLTQSVLTLPDPGVTRRYEDTGFYVCTASNNIPVPSSYVSGSVFFVVEAPPVVLSNTAEVQGQVGNDVTIIVEFYSRPVVSSSDVTWSRGSEELLPSVKFVSSFGARSIMTPFHGVDVQVKGYVAVLNINTLSIGDFGDYTVTIKNLIGMVRYTVVLIATGPPSPPLYLLQKHVTESSITIQWIPGSDEGQTPTFVIGYRSDVTNEYTDLDVIPGSRESVMSFIIEGLTSDTLYYIRVYAQNDIGISDILFLNCSTTNGNGVSHEESYSTRTALISVTSIFVIVVVIEVIVFVIFRMRKTPACLKRDNGSAKQEVHEMRQHSGPDSNVSNESNQLSTYEDLNPLNVSPPSVYEDIHEQDQRTSGDNSEGNTYEILGRKAAPNVYEELSKIT